MESTRLNKIGRLIQKELGDIFQKQTQGMPVNDFANTQTAGFQTQMVPYIEMQSLRMLKQPE